LEKQCSGSGRFVFEHFFIRSGVDVTYRIRILGHKYWRIDNLYFEDKYCKFIEIQMCQLFSSHVRFIGHIEQNIFVGKMRYTIRIRDKSWPATKILNNLFLWVNWCVLIRRRKCPLDFFCPQNVYTSFAEPHHLMRLREKISRGSGGSDFCPTVLPATFLKTN
jgi:hypothetical protein